MYRMRSASSTDAGCCSCAACRRLLQGVKRPEHGQVERRPSERHAEQPSQATGSSTGPSQHQCSLSSLQGFNCSSESVTDLKIMPAPPCGKYQDPEAGGHRQQAESTVCMSLIRASCRSSSQPEPLGCFSRDPGDILIANTGLNASWCSCRQTSQGTLQGWAVGKQHDSRAPGMPCSVHEHVPLTLGCHSAIMLAHSCQGQQGCCCGVQAVQGALLH